ncbi:MAG: 3-oxoacyl-[acyl-carrier-protein] synthase III C-terminal domain-containing protein [Hydrogeniiclostridium sp.]
MQKYGNTSAVSIPLLLDEWNRAGKLKKGQHLVMCAFGAGLTTGTAAIDWTI